MDQLGKTIHFNNLADLNEIDDENVKSPQER